MMADTKASSPAQRFLFVNHAAGSLDARPHRHAVFTHVQRSWKHWKKTEEEQVPKPGPRTLKKEAPAFQVKWRIPQSQNARKKSYSLQSEISEERPTLLEGRQANEGLPLPAPNPQRLYRNKPHARANSDRSISPLTIVGEGNSDPFGVFAIPIDPKVNALMNYTRDVYLPGIQGDLNNPGSPAVQREWTECVGFLQDECLALAHLARIASIIACDGNLLARNPTFSMQTLVLKSKTMTILRDRLIESLHDARACNTILMLLNAELYARDLDAAQCHAAVLARLLQTGAVQTDPIFLFKILYHDTQRAAMSLTRPSFDFSEWIPATFNPVFIEPVGEHLPEHVSSEALSRDIDPSMDEFLKLRSIFTTLKHCLALSLLGHRDPNYATLPIVMYGRVTATLIMGRLINHYLDMTEGQDFLGDSQPQLEAYISLTALLWMRAVSRIDNMKMAGNIRIFAANEFILDTIKSMLESHDLRPGYDRIKLWVLYTCACIEISLSKATFQDSVLVSSFLHQTRQMHLNSWAEVTDILHGFLYTELLPPNKSTWSEALDDR